MWLDIKQAYRLSARFALALPAIAAIPIAAEAVQHAVEWRIGMFDSFKMAKLVEEHPQRLAFGHLKVGALFIMGYWAARFLAFQGDVRRTIQIDSTAFALFAMVLVFNVMMAVAQVQAGSWLSAMLPAGWPLFLVGLAAMLLAMLLELYLAAWKAGAALGNPHMHIAASIRIMRGNVGWSFGFTMAMFVPIMVLHYSLNGLAIGRPDALSWTLLALDTILVGYMAILFPATAFIAADRAARKRGASLIGEETTRPVAVGA